MTMLPVAETLTSPWYELVIELIRWLLRYLRDLMQPTVGF